MERDKTGLYDADGNFRSDTEIRKDLALRGELPPTVETPLPHSRDFQYWSSRFRDRQEQYAEAITRVDHVEIQFHDDTTLNFIGDLHVGSPDTDYDRIETEIETIVGTPNSYVIAMGDWVDGYFFNPAQFEQMEQAPEQFEYMNSLLKHLSDNDKLLLAFGGDHDLWAKRSGADPYSRFSEATGAFYMHGIGYMTAKVGDQEYRLTMAHRLQGHSMYNPVHPQTRAERFGSARGSDIIVGAHTHKKGYASHSVSSFGNDTQEVHYISIGPYKASDEYARKLGFTPKVKSTEDMFGSSVTLSHDRKLITYRSDILVANGA